MAKTEKVDQKEVYQAEQVRGRIFEVIVNRAGIRVEDKCWVYQDSASGAFVKVSQPREALAMLTGFGENLFLLDSEDVTDAGMILCVFEDVAGRWSISNYFIERGGFDAQVVDLPVARASSDEEKFIFYLNLAGNDDRCGGWKVMMEDGSSISSKLKFYKELEAKLGLNPALLKRFAQWVKIKYGNRKTN